LESEQKGEKEKDDDDNNIETQSVCTVASFYLGVLSSRRLHFLQDSFIWMSKMERVSTLPEAVFSKHNRKE